MSGAAFRRSRRKQSNVCNYQPCAALQDYVRSYTIAYMVSKQTMIMRQPAFPHHYLIFYPKEGQYYSNDGNSFHRLSKELIAAFTKPVYLTISPLQITIIVTLIPGSLHRLTRMPLYEITNRPLDGVNGFGNELRGVNDQLSDAKTQQNMIQIIEKFLLKKIEAAKEMIPIDHAFKLLINSPGQYSIEQVASISCVSLRQLERQFLERIGSSPTTFIRQVRFTKALRIKRAHPERNWTTIANECGYFDQMHLIRDFKLFTDATPNSLNRFIPAPNLTFA